MTINRHVIHSLLVDFPVEEKHSLFSFKTKIRKTLEQIRGDLAAHAKDHYRNLSTDLTPAEISLLQNAILAYTKEKKFGEIQSMDDWMMLEFMTNYLVAYELGDREKDSFSLIVDEYFSALNNKTKLIDPKQETISSLNIWLQHLINYPRFYLYHLFIRDMGNSYRFQKLGLDECGCINVSHDRLLSDVRVTIEDKILAACKLQQASNPQEPVKLLSMGPGKGLQDFILILKLFNMNIKNIELTLIDHKYEHMLDPQENIVKIYQEDWKPTDDKLPECYLTGGQEDTYNIIRALSLLARNFSDSKLTIYQYPNVEKFKQDKTHPSLDIVYAIDFEEMCYAESQAKKDFDSLSNHLTENGTAFASYQYTIETFKTESNQFQNIETKKFPKVEEVDGHYQLKHQLDNFFK